MKFSNISVLLALVPAFASAQTLEQKWNLDDPSYNYDSANKNFELTYLFSDMLPLTNANTADQTLATIYLANSPDSITADDNCKMEGIDNTYATWGTGKLSISEGGVTANLDGVSGAIYETKKEEKVTITLDTDGIQTDASVFSEPSGGGSARIAFCVRYGLYTATPTTGPTGDTCPGGDTFDAGYGECDTYSPGMSNNDFCESDIDSNGIAAEDVCSECGKCMNTGSTNSYEVNFLESLIVFDINLTAGFDVQGISVAPKDKIKRTANQSYLLEAFQCTGKPDAVNPAVESVGANPFNQGDVITICVQPDATARGDNIYMKRIEEFTYVLMAPESTLLNPVVTSTTQKAIDVNDATATVPKGEMFGLTNIDNCVGETACVIETILFATFYTRAGTVSGNGRGTMQFGTAGATPNSRMLRAGGDRALEEDAAAEGDFDLNFEINSNDAFQGASGASSCMTVLALFGSVVAAFAL